MNKLEWLNAQEEWLNSALEENQRRKKVSGKRTASDPRA